MRKQADTHSNNNNTNISTNKSTTTLNKIETTKKKLNRMLKKTYCKLVNNIQLAAGIETTNNGAVKVYEINCG